MNQSTVAATGPIIVSSVFKSGTWLLRHILTEITQLKPIEPEIIKGEKKEPDDPDNIFCRTGCFYSWHFIPTEDVCGKLIEMNSRPVFLLRNIFDLTVSMYYHFANNIDFEIGREANKHKYFARISKSEGMKKIIEGSQDSNFKWKGLSTHLYQMEQMLAFSGKYPCHIVTYERLVQNKYREIRRIADFLNITMDDTQVNSIIESSSFSAMKTAAGKMNVSSHFRKGKTDSHTTELHPLHIEMIRNVLNEYTPDLERLARESGIEDITVSSGN
jgi:hypothetical protein